MAILLIVSEVNWECPSGYVADSWRGECPGAWSCTTSGEWGRVYRLMPLICPVSCSGTCQYRHSTATVSG